MKKVDWARPVEVERYDGWLPAEVLKVLSDGTAVVGYQTSTGYYSGVFGPTHVMLRNVPETVEKVVWLGGDEVSQYVTGHRPAYPERFLASARVTFTVGSFVEDDNE